MEKILLHSCCAPCSGAILEWMMANGYEPTVYYYNPNIFPEKEYLIRKNENTEYAKKLGVPIIDGDWNHDFWREKVKGLEDEPERGARCLQCFRVRLYQTAKIASEMGFSRFTTTLASSRWKRLHQVAEAGNWAASQFPGVEYWDRNWRKGGLQDRRGALIRENHFYNQLYCGCEFSMRGLAERMARQSEQAKKDEEAAREKIDAALQSISKSA